MEYIEKEVDFEKYCKLCKHDGSVTEEINSDGTKCIDLSDECHTCLNYPSNTNSHKPIMFEEK